MAARRSERYFVFSATEDVPGVPGIGREWVKGSEVGEVYFALMVVILLL